MPTSTPLPAEWPQRGWRDRLTRVLTGPAILRPAFCVVRRLRPVLRIGSRVVVSRHEDVLDVLRRDEDFTVAEVNGARMTEWSGTFILGLDRGEVYDREVAALRRAATPEDLGRIRALVAASASELLAAAEADGRIDVVGGYARVTATRVVGGYFGAPGPDDASTMRWMRALFDVVFLDGGARARMVAALVVADQRPYMEQLIAERRAAVDAGREVPDDVLTRLVRLRSSEPWLDDDAVRRNLNGLIVGALETTSKAVAHVVHELLRHPDALASARRAALAGDLDEVQAICWEAMRFRPHGPILQRHCARDTTIGRRGTRVRAGSTVFVGALSGMFDPAAFPRPGRIQPDRPADRYLHFGHGMHTCFGKLINEVQVTELVAALVRLPGLRRARGGEGRLRYDGPFPDRLVVEFDRAAAP